MAKKKKSKPHQPSQHSKPAHQSNVIVRYVNKHPNFLPIAILFTLLLVFYHEVAIGGKTFFASDRLNSASIGAFVKDALDRGIYPLWCPYLFSGMPSFASLASAPYIDILGDVIKAVLWPFKQIFPMPDFVVYFINYVLFGFFTFLLLLRKTGVRMVALFAALAMIFQPHVIAFGAFGHGSKLTTAALIPIIFLLLDEFLQKRRLHLFALLAMAVGLQLLRAHTQMAYYTFMMIGLYLIYWMIESVLKKTFSIQIVKSVSFVAMALLIGLIMSAWLYLPVQEYAQYSIRGGAVGLDYDYATSWSFSPQEITTFLIPFFTGFGGETYWGPMPFTDFPLYMGIVPLFFAGICLVLKRDRITLFFTILAVLSLIVSFGKHLPILYGPLFKFLPFFNKFRVPTMILILLQFSVVVLSAWGLHAVINLDKTAQQKVRKYIYAFTGLCGFIGLSLLIGKGTYLSWIAASPKNLTPQLQETVYKNAVFDGIKMIILAGVSGFFVLHYLRNRIKSNAFLAAMIGLLIIDLWWVGFKIIDPKPQVNEENHFTENEAVRFLKKDNEPFRIYPVADNKPGNWYVSHKIQNILGYHAAKIRSYQSFLENTGLVSRNRFGLPPFMSKYLDVVIKDGQPSLQITAPGQIPPERFQMDNAILDMLNVKYLISYYPIPDERFKQVVSSQPSVYENTAVLPRAYFVNELKVVGGEEDFYNLLKSGAFDPSEQAVLEEEPEFDIAPSPENSVQVTSYDIHEIKLEAQVVQPALLVLSEIYYPAGWRAFVNGNETKIYKTNAILRSIFLEPGNHNIEFVFKSRSFTIGIWITFGTLGVLLGVLIYCWRFGGSKSKPELPR